MINEFRGKYYFLSNFYSAPVLYDGIKYNNNEAAFQAQKTLDLNLRKTFSTLEPNTAKARGRKIKLREDWEDVKDQIMYEICLAKFSQNENLKNLLLSTNNEELIEGNNWNDTYWGVSYGVGKNKLGMILMKIRSELINL